jgi:hypothetical protein
MKYTWSLALLFTAAVLLVHSCAGKEEQKKAQAEATLYTLTPAQMQEVMDRQVVEVLKQEYLASRKDR